MIRGQLIIDRALATKAPLIDRQRRSLLVVGAGVGGVTAAIRAAQRGVQVTLVEWADAPFGLQAGCPTRYLDPTQYDWPLSQWRERTFPEANNAILCDGPLVSRVLSLPAGMPRYCARQASGLICKSYSARRSVDGLPSFGRLYRTDANGAVALSYEHVSFGAEGSDVFVQVHLRERYPVWPWPPYGPIQPVLVHPAQQFGMLLTSVGFGRERIEATDPAKQHVFRSLEFWDPDDFEFGTLGGKPADQARVLISGSGDGALQGPAAHRHTTTQCGGSP